jgi:hypothetical protein
MTEQETRGVLCAILDRQKQQVAYLHRLHGWIIAIAEALEKQPDLVKHLKEHPTYDQGPLPWIQDTNETIRNIDALIQRLRA